MLANILSLRLLWETCFVEGRRPETRQKSWEKQELQTPWAAKLHDRHPSNLQSFCTRTQITAIELPMQDLNATNPCLRQPLPITETKQTRQRKRLTNPKTYFGEPSSAHQPESASWLIAAGNESGHPKSREHYPNPKNAWPNPKKYWSFAGQLFASAAALGEILRRRHELQTSCNYDAKLLLKC